MGSSDFSRGGFAGDAAGAGVWTPPILLFAVNTLPPQPNAIYRWDDSENWDDSLFWIDG